MDAVVHAAVSSVLRPAAHGSAGCSTRARPSQDRAGCPTRAKGLALRAFWIPVRRRMEGGLTPMEALQSATRNPPRFFGSEDEIGTIAAAKIADLVLLDADPLQDIANTQKISGVVLRGRLLDRATLDTLISAAEQCRPAMMAAREVGQ